MTQLPYRPNPLEFPVSPSTLDGLNATIDDIYEWLRRMSSSLSTLEEGGGAVSGAHDILSATHSDTTPAAEVNGDIIIGSGGKWVRLPKDATNLKFLQLVAGLPAWGVNGSLLTSIPGTAITGPIPVASYLHNLLSASHQDTVAASPVRGDMVVAQDAGGVDAQLCWLAGEATDILPTSGDPGTDSYWLNGEAYGSLTTSGAVAWVRSPVGATGYVWTAGATGPTWQPGAVGTGVGAAIYRATDLIVSDRTPTIVTLDTSTFNDSFWTSGSRLTVPSAQTGTYLVVGAVTFDYALVGNAYISIFVNGAERARTLTGAGNVPLGYVNNSNIAGLFRLVATDYVELSVEVVKNVAGGNHTVKGGAGLTYLQLVRV